MKEIKRLPESELEVMQVIWSVTTPAPRAVIEKELNKNKPLASTTILTFLTRLCDKGFLSVECQGRTNYYTPLIQEREYLASESRNILNKLYGGSIANFAMSLCDTGVSKSDIEELKDMLEKGNL